MSQDKWESEMLQDSMVMTHCLNLGLSMSGWAGQHIPENG